MMMLGVDPSEPPSRTGLHGAPLHARLRPERLEESSPDASIPVRVLANAAG